MDTDIRISLKKAHVVFNRQILHILNHLKYYWVHDLSVRHSMHGPDLNIWNDFCWATLNFWTDFWIHSFAVPTLNAPGRLGRSCFDEANIAFVRLSEVPILSTLLLLVKRLPSTQWLACTCATINKNSFGECFKQLLTTPAKLGQQVNWYRKPFPHERREGGPRNWQYHQRQTHFGIQCKQWDHGCVHAVSAGRDDSDLNWAWCLPLTCCEDIFGYFFIFFVLSSWLCGAHKYRFFFFGPKGYKRVI